MGTVNATAPSTAADRLLQLDIADSSLGDGFACQEERALDVPGADPITKPALSAAARTTANCIGAFLPGKAFPGGRARAVSRRYARRARSRAVSSDSIAPVRSSIAPPC